MKRKVVVTGAASGIGKATADLAESQGWQVIRADLKEGDVQADLSNSQGREQFVEGVKAVAGDSLDAVVACAGLAMAEPVTLKVNYYGMTASIEGLQPLLAEGNHPRAVGIASVASIMSSVPELVEALLDKDEAAALNVATDDMKEALYGSSKAAFARWVRRNAGQKAWAGSGILLNAVAPAMVLTPMTANLTADQETRAGIEQAMPMPIGRDAEPEEIAELLFWLASPANSMMVGQVVFVDGGTDVTLRGDSTW